MDAWLIDVLVVVVVAHLCREVGGKRLGLKTVDPGDARFSVGEPAPDRLQIMAQWRDPPHAGNDDALLVAHESILESIAAVFCPPWLVEVTRM